MDFISIIGTILAFVVLIVGAILKGTDVSALWNPAAFVIVFIGTISALLLHTQGKVLKRAADTMVFPELWEVRGVL